MVTVIRILRILALLALTCIVVSMIVGIFRPETGVLEKIVLVLLTFGCFWLSVGITSLAAQLQKRFLERT